MDEIEVAEKNLDEFIEKYISCASCAFWKKELLGGECISPEYPYGYFEVDTNSCEMHEFKDNTLREAMEKLIETFNNLIQPEIEAILTKCDMCKEVNCGGLLKCKK